MRTISAEELGSPSPATDRTLAAAHIPVDSDLKARAPDATLRREMPRGGAETLKPSEVVTVTDPIGALPHVTVAPDASGDAAASGATRISAAEFHLMKLLGAGGMGQVHLARQSSLQRVVAIKSTRPDANNDFNRKALYHEASITGSLEHPGIVPVHLLGRDDRGEPVMVMKKVEGVTWHALIAAPDHPWWDKLRRKGSDPLDLHLETLRQVCRALEFAHDAGVIHRDIKPENVMLGAFGEVYLLDWGLAARLDAEGKAPGVTDVLGTPLFMAPEQVTTEAGPQTPRTDVYLLGASLHQALTGRYRHAGNTIQEAFLASIQSEPATYPDTVPRDLAALANRATARRPEDRFASAREFRFALEDCIAHRGSMALCRAARASLSVLRGSLAPGDGRPVERDSVVRASAACRFGFAQALAAWPYNDDALAGLQECLDLLFEDELARGNLEGATALASEMPRRTPAHDTDLGALRAKREAEAREVAALQSAAFERDKRVSSRERTRGFVLGVGSLLVFNLLSARTLWVGAEPTYRELLGLGLGGVVAAAVVTWRERASLWRNAYNRALVFAMLLWVTAPLASRAAAALLRAPVAWAVTADMLLLSFLAAQSALTLRRWFGVAAAVFALGALVASIDARHAYAAFVVASSVALTVTIPLALREHARNAQARPDASA
jgi:serine/threonine-protein kinase